MSRPRIAVLVFLASALILLPAAGTASPAPGGGTASPPAYVPGELLVKFNPSAKGLDKASARAQLNAASLRAFRSGAEHWRLGPGHGVEQAVERLKRNPHVAYAEPNYILTADVIPNDPRLNELYGLINTGQTGGTADADIDAELAWGVSTGSSSVIVGVIDTGCDYNHPDLAANIWTNPGEIAANGIDDDGNGFVDDIHGYDFVNNDADPFDDHGHGSHVSGTIGGVGNNGIGVVGVNWEVSIMCLKFLNSGGSGSTAGAIAAVDYSVLMGVDLTSNSWGGGAFSQALMDAIADANANDQAFIAAAGNNGTNNDTSPHYPSNYNLPNVISVAATDHSDAKASFSNYGATTVHLGAPGVNILSTLPGNAYGQLSGTSMATPHVSGVAALIRAVSPGIPVSQLKSVILNSVDLKPSMNGITTSGGRLNAFFSIATPDTDPPDAVNDLAAVNPGSNTMGLTWTAPGDDGSTGTATFYQVRYSTSPIDDMNFGAATRAGNEPNPLPAGSMQSMEVRGLAADTYYYFAVEAFDEWGNAAPVSNLATETTLRPPTAAVDPASHTLNLLTGQVADLTSVLGNVGVGTLDFTISTPSLGDPMSVHQPLELAKDEEDPRQGILGTGGPDGFGYRWSDSDESGGPLFSWTDISGTGTPIAITSDDSTSGPIALGFNVPYYGGFFNSIRVCSNGWLSFTSTSTAYANQPLPNSGAPEDLIAPLWDDLDPGGQTRIYYQTFGNSAIVQWTGMPRYQETGSALTFQAILEESGAITFQYLTLTSGTLNSATVGIQDSAKTTGLTVAYNQGYLHDNLAVRIAALPQWLTVSPTSGRLYENDEVDLDLHVDAAGLEGGTYPGTVIIETNDPTQPVLPVTVSLHITGAPDASVQPGSLDFGDAFLGLPETMTLIVANIGTDTLMVSSIDSSHPGELTPSPSSFNVAPHGSQAVTVSWTPASLGAFSGTLTVMSNDAGEMAIPVPVSGNGIPAPVMIVAPTTLTKTLLSGQTGSEILTVTDGGGSNLILTVSADQGAANSSAPYRAKNSDAPGGPAFNFVDISGTGTQIFGPSIDDSLSATINMGMSFPFFGNSFSSLKVSSNGWLTFTTTETLNRNSNTTLPSSSGAANMIAMYWDDLHTRTGNVKYKLDGNRFIVQYTNVGRFTPSTGHTYTFQVQLYNDGRILVMYQTMSGTTLNSATVGLQNQAKTSGLLVVFQTGSGTPYVHNNLALRMTKNWLSVDPTSATITPGSSMIFNVDFDSDGRLGGALNGGIVFGTNIPSQPTATVPTTLNVIGAPIAAVSPTSIAYGQVYAGYAQLRSFQVLNNGTDDLNVTDIDTTDASLTVEEAQGNGPLAAFDLPPGQSRVFDLRWNPAANVPSALSANVRVHSDDPTNPILMLPVTGTAIVPPVAIVSPTTITDSMNSGEVRDHTVTIENAGPNPLTFSAAVHALGGVLPPAYDEDEPKKGTESAMPGILGSGGPDLFGYRWLDSDAVGGPTFSWTDISGIGTPIPSLTGDDQTATGIPIGFPFQYHGNSFTTVNVSTNGWLSFTNTSTALGNVALPSSGSGVPENLLAAFWDDLHFRGAVRAHYHYDGTKFIVQYTDVDKFSPTGSHLTFQVILYPNGRFRYQYLTMTGTLNSATIGEQNSTRNDGLTVAFNTAYVHDSLAVEFRPPFDFLQISPLSGTINPGDPAVLMNVRIDSANLIGGDYSAVVDVLTNDPANGLVPISVMFHVTGIPDIDASPASLAFPTTFVGYSSSLPATISNVGTEALQVTGSSITGDFSVSGLTTPVTLPVGGTIPLTVTFAPNLAGAHSGLLTVTSDDPDEPSVTIALSGDALIPPEIGVTPASISTALPPGGTRTKSVEICNDGGSELTWTAGTSIISSLGSPVTVYDELELGRDEVDPRPGILGSGGPDMFGYGWVDSDDPGGPAFGWVDISGVGTPITFNATGYCVDCTSGPFAIGFSFPYYGSLFSTARVTTEGWISFTNTSTAYSNQPLPNSGSGVPENLLAAFWDDLVLRNGTGSEPDDRISRAYYHFDGTKFIVQWEHFYRIANYTDDLNFQIILYPSGKIVYQYLSMSSGTLNSATIGQQNATKTDGLTIVHNAGYMHDGLAIEIASTPEWLTLSPTTGAVQVGECEHVTATLNAAGLDDGLHEATIQIASNDPAMPVVPVPVTLNVGLADAMLVDIDPDVLNLGASGNTAKVVIELPAGLDPHAINFEDISINGVGIPVVKPPNPSYGDADGDGLEEVTFKIDREALAAVLPDGDSVPVTVQGEVTDVQWWSALGSIRAIRPHVVSPMGGEVATAGGILPIVWTAPVWSGSVSYDVHLSRDGGMNWEGLAAGLTATSFDWIVSGPATSRARIRVIALNNSGPLGWDLNDGEFTITGPVLQAPNPIDPYLLEVLMGTQGMTLRWSAPMVDIAHDAADRYRILRAEAAQGPYSEISVVTQPEYTDAAVPAPGGVFFLTVVASNVAGDAN